MGSSLWRTADGTVYRGTKRYGIPYAKRLFPGFSLRGAGMAPRNGFNIYPASEWGWSRGFLFRLGRLQYHLRWSVPQGRLIHGWEWRRGD